MRLITHNMLMCNTKRCVEEGDAARAAGTPSNYPLVIVPKDADSVSVEEVEYNAELVKNMVPKLEWPAVVEGARQIGVGVPDATPTEEADEETLRALHRVLFETHVKEGHLHCALCGRDFPINNGIPNMLLHDDEV